MIKIDKTQVMGWEAAIRGMWNPLNNWINSDSRFQGEDGVCYDLAGLSWPKSCDNEPFRLGANDHDMMIQLVKTDSVDSKFRRMITVYVEFTAPLYWWNEFDTYKVGTAADPCSTMHKINAKEFTLDDFSYEHLGEPGVACLRRTIKLMNAYRRCFIDYDKPHDPPHKLPKKEYWWQMIQLLPLNYNQKHTVMLNYEVLANIYQHWRDHNLDECREVCQWIENLPYSEIITCNVIEKN